MFYCTSTQASAARKSALENLEDKLVSVSTHRDITILILMAVKGEIDALRKLDLSADNDVMEVANQQDCIGWHLVKFGIVTTKWYRVQEMDTSHQ